MKRLLLILVATTLPCGAYSALSHEAIVDAVWQTHIRPMLLKRFPNATPDQLKEAHAYTYGGCQIQDMGYFPFSSHEFSDWTHYIRTGDFVAAMIRDSETLDEYAFALGALAHYTSDRTGHPAVNRSTALEYPKLRRKYGAVVTYEDSPADHLKTEFAFDVIQVSRGLYAPDAFHDFIGFQVSKTVLQKAFQDTYGVGMDEIFGTLDLGIGTYRFTLGRLIPEMTKVAWHSKRADIEKLSPGITRSRFVYALPRRRYRAEWDDAYHRPGWFARFLAFVFRMIPTMGPFRLLKFNPVPPQAERDFLRSFDATVTAYRAELTEVRNGNLAFVNYNLDTGQRSGPGEYQLADKSYVELLDKLAQHHFSTAPPELRKNLAAYFKNVSRSALPQKEQQELVELQSQPPSE